MAFLGCILVGLAVGWLAGRFWKGTGIGVLGDLVVGMLGALVGGFLFQSQGLLLGGGWIGSMMVATIGAVSSLFFTRMLKAAH